MSFQTDNGNLAKNLVIPAHFPNPLSPAGADYQLIYSLEVLTNRPDGWRIQGSSAKGLRVISEIDGFEKTIKDDIPPVWINYPSAGDEARIKQLGDRYREKLNFGAYQIFYRPLDRPLTVLPPQGTLQQNYLFKGEDFDPGEKISLWVSYDSSGAKNLESLFADEKGNFSLNYKPGPLVPGTFALTARGDKSNRRAIGQVLIK